MRGLLGSLILLVMTAGLVPAQVRARDVLLPDGPTAANDVASPAPADTPSVDVRTPWDVAPSRQTVGRDLMSFRKEGTLLSKTTREIPIVDERKLLERKYAMYAGQRFYLPPSRADRSEPGDADMLLTDLAAAAVPPVAGTPSYGLAWTLAAAITAAILVGWRKGWFVPFSMREERRAVKVASARHRSRRPKGPPRKVQPPAAGG